MTKDDGRKMWLVWRAWHDKFHPSIIYEALPESHEGKRGIYNEPMEIEGEDRFLSLDQLAKKYPPLRKEK